MTGEIESVGHQVVKNSPIVRVTPGDDGPAGGGFIAKPLHGPDGEDIADLSSTDSAARFKKTGIEKQTVARTYLDARVLGGFEDTSRIILARCERFLHIHVRVVLRGNERQRSMGSRRREQMNDVRLNLAHHLFHVRVYAGNCVASGLIARHRCIEIADCNDLNIR